METTMSYISSRKGAARGTVPGRAAQRAIFSAHGLVSALDMFKFNASIFAELVRTLELVRSGAQYSDPGPGGPNAPLPKGTLEALREPLSKLSALLSSAALKQAPNAMTLTRAKLEVGTLSQAALKEQLEVIQTVLELELREHLFMYIPTDRAPWFDKALPSEILTALPTAKDDLIEMGNCYAAGRFTAAVFHAMCVVDLALVAMAKKVGVKADLKTWADTIDNANSEITKIFESPQGPSRQEELDARREALMVFRLMKDVWRNHVMHARARHNQDVAKFILGQVEAFVGLLAKNKLL